MYGRNSFLNAWMVPSAKAAVPGLELDDSFAGLPIQMNQFGSPETGLAIILH